MDVQEQGGNTGAAALSRLTWTSMAPCSRLEEKLRKLGLSTDDGGCSRSSPASKTKYSFRIFFPLPPYDGLQFNALRSGTGFNFTGQLLGIGGKQLQRIKQESAARLEVNNAEGNLNGSHPDPLDPNLHALISADSLSKLHKAAMMVWELLAPVNGKFLPIDVVPGGSVRLTVAQPAKAPAAAAKAAPQQKQSSKANKTDAAPSSSSSSSSSQTPSTADSRPVSASPLLTPVTPAAAACQRPSRSIEVTPGSSSCSCGNTHSASSHCSRSGSSSSSTHGSMFSTLDGFSLPPAALSPAAPTSAAHASPDKTPEQQQQQQQQVTTEAGWGSSGLQEEQLLQPATPGRGAAAAAARSSETASIHLSPPSQQQGQQQQERQHHHHQQQPLAGSQQGGSECCGQLPTPAAQASGTAARDLALATHCYATGETGSAAWHAAPPEVAAPSETAFAGAAGAAAAELCLLPPGAVLQKPDWHEQQQQQQPVSPAAGLEFSAVSDSNPGSCFQYGLGLSSTSLDNSSSFCAKDSPALQALIVDHQRQQQQQMLDQQMHLMHMMHMQQQAHVGSLGSSQGTFGSSASLFGGPSPLLGPHTSSCMGSFEGDSLQLGPSALGSIACSAAGSTQQQPGLAGVQMHPAGLSCPGMAAGQPCCNAAGPMLCSAGLPESPPCGSYGQMRKPGPGLQGQQGLAAADCCAAARGGLAHSCEAPAALSSSIGHQSAGPGLQAGNALGGLHLPGSSASCWAAGVNELPGNPMLSGVAPHSGGQICEALSLAWPQAQHGSEEQQQQEMLMMLHAMQQGHPVQHQQQLALPISVIAGPSLEHPGRASIW